jgi:peptidoglycan/xylan/chitin deacetylase (PgdA/CDA1 family)
LEGLRPGSSPRTGIRVLMYHGVVERRSDERAERNLHLLSDFREHVRFLRRWRVLDLDTFGSTRDTHVCEDPRSALITFDDAYRSTLLAAEVLREAGLPFTVFVPTGLARTDGSRPLWTVELSLLLLRGGSTEVGLLGQRWSLEDRRQRVAAHQTIRLALKRMNAATKEQTLDELRAQFPAGESDKLLCEFPSLEILSWSEIKDLTGMGAAIGSHGVWHEIHHAAQSPEVRHRELVDSREELREQIGHPCRAFAFPDGKWMRDSPAEVAAAGYDLAFTTDLGTVQPDSERLALPRLFPPGRLDRFVAHLLSTAQPR